MSSYNVWILHMLVSCVIFICRIFWGYRRTLALYWHARAQDKYINWFSRSNLRISPLYSSKRAVLNWNQITLTGFVLRFAKVLRRLFSMKTKSFFFSLMTDCFCNLKWRRYCAAKTAFLSWCWRFPLSAFCIYGAKISPGFLTQNRWHTT